MNDVTDAALRRGQALLGLGRAREAEEQLRTALAGQPDDTMVQVLLAQALLRQEKYGEAHDVSRGALAAEPENVFAHAVHAGSLAGLSRHPEALTTIRRGIALAPNVAGLHLQEASILLADDRAEEALACIKKARALDPEDSGAAALQAAALHDAGRFAEAELAVADALRLDPENADAHRIQGLLALRRGGGKSAVRSQRTALRLDPTDKGAREGLSLALKTRNPLYGQLLRFQLWLGTLPKGVRIAVLIAPFILSRVLRPYNGQTWATVVLGVSIGLVVLSWTLEPIMNCVLLLSRDRHVVDRPARVATYGFLAFAAAAIACAVISTTSGPTGLLGLTFALGLWAMATGLTHTVSPGMRKIVLIGAAVATALAALGVAALVAGAPGAGVAVALVLFSGVAATWVTALA
ncbi:Tetratricopeptide repeat-containing protein [Actinokineospora alba]|uniref:Tetratricopeptide repeat-containing protein n=1 Tax=Actinokineospora alba TaxID=504798 RepID=A0A1H0EYP5_9PSEU|nr:tetratricopeptide repeat protein [Actinokineospora alba]TDP69276.1 tetratricopeptide repeat protein [Actinokineospora alba]SDI20464.1 Tetratricopeptide repeat-containing protein [Actinokineospora alba]SDN87502.1 Tetratricopeptide repeat-containing protein [Actinokineospora alba]